MGFGRRGYWAAANYAPYAPNQEYAPSYAPPVPAAPARDEEVAALKEYVAGLEGELKEAKKRLLQLEAKK
jgi:hypothetical protein